MNPRDALQHLDQGNLFFDLQHLTCIDVESTNASAFLQGQLTCDVRLVSEIKTMPSALCNLQGRIVALMNVVKWQGLKLIVAKEMCPLVLNALKQAALFSRVILKENPLTIFGLYQPKHHPCLSNETTSITALDADFYLGLSTKPINQLDVDTQYTLHGSLAWHFLQLKKTNIDVYPESSGIFLPHRLNLHQKQHLSFTKGCYKGQEIIARMHHRGTLKHDVRVFTLKTPEALVLGQPLWDNDHQNIMGELLDYCPIDDGAYLVAVSVLIENKNRP